MGSRCAVSSAVSTGCGLVQAHSPDHLFLTKLEGQWALEAQGWVPEGSKRYLIDINDDKVKDVLYKIAELMTKEARDWVTHLKENQGS